MVSSPQEKRNTKHTYSTRQACEVCECARCATERPISLKKEAKHFVNVGPGCNITYVLFAVHRLVGFSPSLWHLEMLQVRPWNVALFFALLWCPFLMATYFINLEIQVNISVNNRRKNHQCAT